MGNSKLVDLQAREAQRRLSKEQLLTPRRVEVDVYLESLDGTVRIRSLSHAQRQEIHEAGGVGTEKMDTDKINMLTIVASVVEPELTEADVEALRSQDVHIIDELTSTIGLLNLTGQAGELKKGSRKTRNSDSALN